MFNVQCSMFKVQGSRFNVQCSMFNVQCSMFKVQCSMFNVQCSMFNVQCSMFNVQCSMFPPTILINKVCFPFACLGVSASEGAVVVRPVPRGPCGPRMRRSRHLSVSCAFLRFFCRNPSHDAVQCRSVFPQKVRICDIFRGFPARSVPAGWVFQTGNRRSGAFFHVFLSCNRLSFSAEGKK